jgi:hypothetical protein
LELLLRIFLVIRSSEEDEGGGIGTRMLAWIEDRLFIISILLAAVTFDAFQDKAQKLSKCL